MMKEALNATPRIEFINEWYGTAVCQTTIIFGDVGCGIGEQWEVKAT
jgi:hypothetical protein